MKKLVDLATWGGAAVVALMFLSYFIEGWQALRGQGVSLSFMLVCLLLLGSMALPLLAACAAGGLIAVGDADSRTVGAILFRGLVGTFIGYFAGSLVLMAYFIAVGRLNAWL